MFSETITIKWELSTQQSWSNQSIKWKVACEISRIIVNPLTSVRYCSNDNFSRNRTIGRQRVKKGGPASIRCCGCQISFEKHWVGMGVSNYTIKVIKPRKAVCIFRKRDGTSTYLGGGGGGTMKQSKKILQGRSLFDPVVSIDNMLLRIIQQICIILPGHRSTSILGYLLSGHCSLQQISVKHEGEDAFRGVLIYGVLRCFQRGTYLRGFTIL